MPKGIQGFQKGHIIRLGTKHSKKTKEKISRANSISLLGKHCSPRTEFKKGNIPWNKNRIFPQYSMEKSFNWKGGRTMHAQGYVCIYIPTHPYSNNGYVFEHRLVMEHKLGRYLKPKERVHHINEIKDDNRPENLMYFTNESKHQKFHNR